MTDPPVTENRASPDQGNIAGYSAEGYTEYVTAPGCWMGNAHSDVANPCPYGVTLWRSVDFNGRCSISALLHFAVGLTLRNSDVWMFSHWSTQLVAHAFATML